MRLFKSDMVNSFLQRMNVPDDVPIEAKMVSNAIKSAQSQVEAQHFEIRKDILKYDDVLNRQRLVIYDERRRVLEGADIHEQVRGFLDDVVSGYVRTATSEGYPESWDLEQLWTALRQLYPVGVTIAELEQASGGSRAGLSADFLEAELTDDIQEAYDRREAELGEEVARELERRVILSVLDRKWREHLYEMDYLRDGIGLRAMAQRDPLIEYQREGYDLFVAMMDGIKEESVGYLFNVEVQVQAEATDEVDVVDLRATDAEGDQVEAVAAEVEHHAPVIMAPGLEPMRRDHLEYTAPSETGEVVHDSSDAGGSAPLAVDPNASRAERRRAERENRKRQR